MRLKLIEKTVTQLAALLEAGEVTRAEVVEAYLERIASVEEAVAAFLYVNEDRARKQARLMDEAAEGGAAVLGGVPVALKDNICTKGIPTTCGSRILEGYRPPYSATAAVRLEKAGFIMLGKTNCDEFAMGSSTENSGYHPTANPWDLRRVPGGSSGGSAAAVAAFEVPCALGSDTGGSIRQPASFCGVVGLKPTYGLVSRYGLVAFASSLDQIGPITRDVADAAAVLSVIAGHDPLDSTSARVKPVDYTHALVPDVDGLTAGVVTELSGEGVDPEVRERVGRAVEVLTELGVEVEECSLPHARYALDMYYIIAPAEASSNLARYDGTRYGYRHGVRRLAGTGEAGEAGEAGPDGVEGPGGGDSGGPGGSGRPGERLSLLDMYVATRREGFGAEVKRRIMLGTYVLSAGYYEAYYLKAQKARTLLRQDFERAFARYDFLVSPTSPTVAFPLGDRVDDPLRMYMADLCTIPANLAGIPAISVPCGFAQGLPVGLQLMGPAFSEELLLKVAFAYEQHTEHHTKKPPLLGVKRR
ncbi:MAG TPA: Asp-tRNA(Asn)/Glu-tRNA(Gln) amidotransferase subunit GatA [Clostridiales bacterium]|nr:Asp-tRNA(Asn)/Glu-tRNA(Gln) amidotransferase subunit GatA [Clostridiales bacterium]